MSVKDGEVRILAIESSCDETSAAIISGTDSPVIENNIIASQIDIHAVTGGVVPEIASRAHAEKIIPVIEEALGGPIKEKISEIDAIAVTQGPGLVGSLLIGLETAKTLSFANNIPLIPVNHLEGHIYSALVDQEFPVIALIVSGGNTQLVLVKNQGDYEIIGQTLDDAAGEAFDKVAVLLGLNYPGGADLSKLADQANLTEIKDFERKINKKILPRPMINTSDLNFSFSGLKTAVVNFLRENPDFPKVNLAYAFQQAVIDVLLTKTKKAVGQYQPKKVLLVGGVAANTKLRQAFQAEFGNLLSVTPLELSGDNAGMIGLAAWYKFKAGQVTTWDKVNVEPNLRL